MLKISGQFNSQDGARIECAPHGLELSRSIRSSAIGTLNDFSVDSTQTILMDSIAVRKNHFEREMDMSKDPKIYNFSQPYYRDGRSPTARVPPLRTCWTVSAGTAKE